MLLFLKKEGVGCRGVGHTPLWVRRAYALRPYTLRRIAYVYTGVYYTPKQAYIIRSKQAYIIRQNETYIIRLYYLYIRTSSMNKRLETDINVTVELLVPTPVNCAVTSSKSPDITA